MGGRDFFLIIKKYSLPYVYVVLPGKDGVPVGAALCVEVPGQTGQVWTYCYQRHLRVNEMNGAHKYSMEFKKKRCISSFNCFPS